MEIDGARRLALEEVDTISDEVYTRHDLDCVHASTDLGSSSVPVLLCEDVAV